MFALVSENWVWWAIVGAVFGLIFGSAINAMTWRWKKGESWTKGRSKCTDCGHVLEPADLIPVVSYVMLRGRCRYCHKPIKDPPAVELVSAAVFALSAAVLAPVSVPEWVRLGFWTVMLVLLLALALIDWRWMKLPYALSRPLIVVALVYAIMLAVVTHDGRVFAGAVEAAVVVGGLFFALVYFSGGRGMGDGDVYLVIAMGLMLGIQGMVVALFLAFNAGAVVGVALIASHRRTRKDLIPFGPYLIGATVVAFLFGRQIFGWYLRLNGL